MKLKELIKSMLENLAYDILKSILVVIFSGGLSYPLIYNFLSSLKEPLKGIPLIIISVAIAALVAFVMLVLYQYFSVKYLTIRKIEGDYSVVKKVVSFTYDGNKSYYETVMTLKFNSTTREYYGKYYWSGSGSGKIWVTENGFTLNVLKQRTRYIEYAVIFDKAYKKNSELTFHIRGEMEDPNGIFSPYFATTVTVPTEELEIILNIPLKYSAHNFEKEIVPPHMYNHEESTPFKLDSEGKYVWKISRPKLSYQYSINWCF